MVECDCDRSYIRLEVELASSRFVTRGTARPTGSQSRSTYVELQSTRTLAGSAAGGNSTARDRRTGSTGLRYRVGSQRHRMPSAVETEMPGPGTCNHLPQPLLRPAYDALSGRRSQSRRKPARTRLGSLRCKRRGGPDRPSRVHRGRQLCASVTCGSSAPRTLVKLSGAVIVAGSAPDVRPADAAGR
jgi:hypothetical protein